MHRRWGLIAALSLALMVPAIGGAQNAAKKPASTGPKPVIEIPKMKHDFGEVFEREKYEYTFIVRNRGNADLVIEDVKPG
jgi:hypothetical protein